MIPVRSPKLQSYGLALMLTAVALLARWLLDPVLGNRLPFVTFFIAVAAAIGYAGLRPALLATVLGGVLALLFFVPERQSLNIVSIPDFVGMIMYVSVTLAIVGFGHAMWVARGGARLAEQEARQQQGLLMRTLMSIGDAVITTDKSGRVTMLNPVAERLTGWTNAQAIGQPLESVFRIVEEETRNPIENPVAKVFKSGAIVGLANHTWLISKDGKELPIADSAAPIWDEDDVIAGVVLVFRDISKQNAADKALAESEGRKSAILDSAVDGIVGIDDQGLIIEFNPAAEQLFGYKRQDVIGREMAELIIPAQWRDRHRIGMKKYLQSGEQQVLNRLVELTAVNSIGGEFPVEVSILRIEHNARTEFFGYIRDISQRKRNEFIIRRSEERFRALTVATTSIVWTTDDAGKFVDRQQAWSEYTGQTWEQYRGMGWLDAIHRGDREQLKAHWLEAVGKTAPYRSAGRLWHAASGSYRYFESHAVPLRNNDGKVREWIGSCKDIEKEKQLEEDVQQSMHKISLANKRKNEFLATLAHELRNPLAPIRNALEIIKMSKTDEDVLKDANAIVQRQLDQLIRLVDDLLDISRISHGKIELRKEIIELTSIVHFAVESVRPLIGSKEQELSVELPADPVYLRADPQRLTQIIANLLNNSATFSPEGGQLKLSVRKDYDDVLISIQDNGIGIDADLLTGIFELFVQADTSLERSSSGLGIGLTLVKTIVELHGGNVVATSAGIGEGSEFIVRLPTVKNVVDASVGEIDAHRNNSLIGPSRRILIVDDNKDAADSLAQLLDIAGHEANVAYDGHECLSVVDKLNSEIVILDIGMPNLNGYDVARTLREKSRGKRMFLIALTGWGQDSDRQRSIDAGFDKHFVKPVDMRTLMSFVAQLPEARQ
jgi:PAS domain S-box-containing protein